MEDIKRIIESLLFITDEPLSIDRFRKILHPIPTAEIRNALDELTQEYRSRESAFYLKEVAGGFQFRTYPQYNEWIKRLIQPKPHRLSKAALETLAIVAYKQPVIRSDVEHIRGVDCGGVIRVLLERNFIRVLGRKEIPGRPLIYGTTKRFLEVFDLKDLKDLPTPKEIEELGKPIDGPPDETVDGIGEGGSEAAQPPEDTAEHVSDSKPVEDPEVDAGNSAGETAPPVRTGETDNETGHESLKPEEPFAE